MAARSNRGRLRFEMKLDVNNTFIVKSAAVYSLFRSRATRSEDQPIHKEISETIQSLGEQVI